MNVRIGWHPNALDDIYGIEAYIERDNPPAAQMMEMRIRAAVNMLAEHPNLGRAGRVSGTREPIVAGTPYLVAYAVLGDEIRVLAVLHGVQKWPEAF